MLKGEVREEVNIYGRDLSGRRKDPGTTLRRIQIICYFWNLFLKKMDARKMNEWMKGEDGDLLTVEGSEKEVEKYGEEERFRRKSGVLVPTQDRIE